MAALGVAQWAIPAAVGTFTVAATGQEAFSSRFSLVTSILTGGGWYPAASTRRVPQKWLPNSAPGQRVQARAVREIKGDILKGRGLRIAVVAARFNDIITKPLLAGALETFRNYGLNDKDIDVSNFVCERFFRENIWSPCFM